MVVERDYSGPDQVADAKLLLKEYERCAFGRGWESRRRGEGKEANPFTLHRRDKILAFYWECWNDGWEQFKVGKDYAAA